MAVVSAVAVKTAGLRGGCGLGGERSGGSGERGDGSLQVGEIIFYPLEKPLLGRESGLLPLPDGQLAALLGDNLLTPRKLTLMPCPERIVDGI